MPVDIAQHPNFGAKMAKYQADKAAAATSGDPTAVQAAELSWERDRGDMTRELYEQQDAARQRSDALARIKAENPLVPEEVYSGIGNIAEAEAAAKKVQERLAQATGGSWGPAAGGGGAAASGAGSGGAKKYEDYSDAEWAAESPEVCRQVQMEALARLGPVVMEKGALARRENFILQKAAFQPVLDRFQASQGPRPQR